MGRAVCVIAHNGLRLADTARWLVDGGRTTYQKHSGADQWSRVAAKLTRLEAIPDTRAGSVVDIPGPPTRFGSAVSDIVEGFRQNWLWVRLAHQDLRLRYRGSVLGPLWQTLTTAIMIGTMGLIYAKLFHTEIEDYLPMLAVGLILWQFSAGMITEGCGTFDSVRDIIQQVKLPFSLHAYRLVYRNVLVLAHSFVIVPIVLIMFPHPIEWLRLLELGPGFVLIVINGVAISVLLGMISARFRDVPPIVANIVQVVFFVTPIIWSASALGEYKWFATFNPLYPAIDVIRAPLLGQPTEAHSWAILVMVTTVNCAASFLFFSRFRSRIAFWV